MFLSRVTEIFLLFLLCSLLYYEWILSQTYLMIDFAQTIKKTIFSFNHNLMKYIYYFHNIK